MFFHMLTDLSLSGSDCLTCDLTTGIIIALGRIIDRLREDAYFGNVYHLTLHRVRVLANRRKSQFDKYAITNQLQRVIGI